MVKPRLSLGGDAGKSLSERATAANSRGDGAAAAPAAAASSAAGDCDVFVLGGGPAGTTIATLLRERSWNVVLAEQDRHPRFHIGESLLPMNLPLLERLGVLEEVRAIGVVKHAAEFACAGGGDRKQRFYFREAMDPVVPYAFQVRRSEFDEILCRNAEARGVAVHEGTRVRKITFRPGERHLIDATDCESRPRQWQARFVVDASGRDTFLARKLDLKEKNRTHGSAAIFGHFHNVPRWDGPDGGNINIYWFEHGWFWMIPLRDGVMSVGAVCSPDYLKSRGCDLETFFWRTVALCPEVAARMKNAAAADVVRATGNYSYRARQMYGDGYILVGDAFAFIDPVFSSGVHLAMAGATLGAEAVDAWLRDPKTGTAELRRFDRKARRAIRTVSWFIYRFTSPSLRSLFLAPRNVMRMQQAIISILAGDLHRRTPIGLPVLLFKVVYYVHALGNLRAAWASSRWRRRNAASQFGGGTLHVDNPEALA